MILFGKKTFQLGVPLRHSISIEIDSLKEDNISDENLLNFKEIILDAVNLEKEDDNRFNKYVPVPTLDSGVLDCVHIIKNENNISGEFKLNMKLYQGIELLGFAEYNKKSNSIIFNIDGKKSSYALVGDKYEEIMLNKFLENNPEFIISLKSKYDDNN